MLQRSDRKRITPLRQNKTARIKKHFELLILLLSFIVGFVHALTSFGSYWNQLPLVAPLNSDPSSKGWLLYYLLLLTPAIPVNTSLWTADGTKKEHVYQGSSKDGIKMLNYKNIDFFFSIQAKKYPKFDSKVANGSYET